jgi:hypothetical protein
MRILREETVITRKRHTCSGCLRAFDKGTKMKVQINAMQNIDTFRLCPTCAELLEKHWKFFADPDTNLCYNGCIHEELVKGQTAQDLLVELNKKTS